jgi:hypothetical protein
MKMANRRTTRGQPEYLQFRPYRAILGSGDVRFPRRSLLRALAAGFVAWSLLAGIGLTLAAAAYSKWRNGTNHVETDLASCAPWILGIALMMGLLGACVNVSRR